MLGGHSVYRVAQFFRDGHKINHLLDRLNSETNKNTVVTISIIDYIYCKCNLNYFHKINVCTDLCLVSGRYK